jgi:hypothetical protein
MKANFFCFGGFLTMLVLGSCGSSSDIVNRPVYYDTVITHDKFMRTNYANKVQVFSKYGVATRKDTLQNIEVWYYRLGESTKSQTETINNSKGEVQQNPWNLVLPPISQSVNVETRSTSSGITYSVSTDNYVQFWFHKDSVIKYDSKGVDYSVVRVREPRYEYFEEYESEKRKNSGGVFFAAIGFAIVFFLLVRVAG